MNTKQKNGENKLHVIKNTLQIGLIVLSVIFLNTQVSLSAQIEEQELTKRHFIGSSLFLLGNLDTKEPPAFFN